MKKIDLAYLAGILDGEGKISIVTNNSGKYRNGKRRKRMQLLVFITNSNEWLINWVFFNFGGTIYKPKKKQSFYKQIYVWQISSAKALGFLKLILPYLKIKKPQAELAIKFQEKKSNNFGLHRHLSDEQMAVEEAEHILMKTYNDRTKKPIEGTLTVI